MKRRLKQAEAVLLWPRVVGEGVARFSSARTLSGGVLYVDVSDSETAMHLSLQRSRFLDEYRERFGVRGVREIRFQVGRVAPRAEPALREPGAGRSAVPADPRDVAELAREMRELKLPPEAMDAALQAGKSLLSLIATRKAQGYVPCPTCGALHDGPLRARSPREEALAAADRRDEDLELARQLCAACHRYSRASGVRSAARALKLSPLGEHPELSEDEAAVARRLAVLWLDADIRELLPAAALTPALLQQLERAARFRVALTEGVEPAAVTAEQIGRLDERITKLLGRLPGWSAPG